MGWVISAMKSSVGAKVAMALSGLGVLAWVFGHLVGNLQIYAGPEAINSYAAWLHSKPQMLWAARLGLLAAVGLHIVSGVRLAVLNRRARPVSYQVKKYTRARINSRTMALSGLVILAFVVYHLLHLTLGVTHPEYASLIDNSQRQDVYAMVVLGFRNGAISASYIVAMILLGFHLSHGVSSAFQSMGLNSPKYTPALNLVGPALAAIIVLGNISMPVSVMLGVVGAGVIVP